MSARVFQILEIYRRLYRETGKEQPFLKNARFVPLQASSSISYL